MSASESYAATAAPAGAAATAFSARILIGLFAVVTFLNAALLFAVQPMFTKMVLPLLGGTPMVWNTCLLFFQAALLLGYLYAHASSQWFRPRTQGLVHIALLLGALAFLPLAVPRSSAPPTGVGLPVLWLLALLAASLGLPFVLLSAGAPMFQRWFATTRHPSADNPYVLYVASNLGSFAALLAYPTLIEPRLRVSEQSIAWLWIYYVLLALVGLAWWLTARWARSSDPVGKEMIARAGEIGATLPGGGAPPAAEDSNAAPAASTSLPPPALTIVPTAAWRLRWVLLSFAPSSLLIGVTTYLSTDVAAVPLLWIVPLALYLLTFVVVFARRPILNRRFMLDFQLFMGLAVLLIIGMTAMSLRVLVLHLIGFFATALVCHRELADSRPQPRHLTEFYLWMSLGGMLGGVFNVIVAPLVYDRVLEYPFALIVAYGLRPAIGRYSTTRRTQLLDLVLPLMLYLGMRAAFHIELPVKWATPGSWTLLIVSALVASAFYKRPLRLALGAAAVFFAVEHRDPPGAGLVYQDRSFFGVYRVHRWGEFLVLQHGTTTHGAQNLQPDRRREPLTYYHRGGPLGDVFATLTDSTAVRNVALVGLGAGSTACYAHAGETWTFYEIDPVVVDIARSGRLFTYLRDCAPDSRIVLGDARLSLVEAADSSFDLVVLDAFSSDAIPVHLMTREALALYLRKLKPGGAVAFHISNRYLDLEPVIVELARDAKVAGAVGDFNASQEDKAAMNYASRWIVLARDAGTLAPLVKDRGWTVLPPSADVRVWTDDFSDIIDVLKR